MKFQVSHFYTASLLSFHVRQGEAKPTPDYILSNLMLFINNEQQKKKVKYCL